MTSHCSICNRPLNIHDDPLSEDCGGDCWGCIGEIEADSGYEPSLIQVRQEYKEGLRQDWLPSPITSHIVNGDLDKECEITLNINLNTPLGNPWCDEQVDLRIHLKLFESKRILFIKFENEKEVEIERATRFTNEEGLITYTFKYKPQSQNGELWYEIKRKSSSWAYPIRRQA